VKINYIAAKNYRTLEDFEVSFGSNYSTLSGHNNAGKSCVLQLMVGLFEKFENTRFSHLGGFSLNYAEDFTQWVEKGEDPISIEFGIELTISDDPMMIAFIAKIATMDFTEKTKIELKVSIEVNSKNQKIKSMIIENEPVPDLVCDEILEKFSSSRGLIIHNSAPSRSDYYTLSRYGDYYELDFSTEEQDDIRKAETTLQNRVQKYARSHKDELNEVLGKLTQKFDVEFTTLQSESYSRPVTINLKDKHVKVPLSGWGSGTQNRTRILMSILRAKKHASENTGQKVTPVIIIEEPESFLHPTAQAEFGRILEELSNDLGIQIVAATHSPYMLNQSEPKSNFLLCRKLYRGKQTKTEILPSEGDKWMAPFAEHLGVIPPEFESWKDVFGLKGQQVVLVEGKLDVGYFEFLYEKFNSICKLPNDLRFESYGGMGALKNTTLLKFALRSLGRTYITFDLDVDKECSNALEKLGLKRHHDFTTVGLDTDGFKCIEGLLPERISAVVYSRNVELIQKLQSGDTKVRNEAKNTLKNRLLEEFKQHDDYTEQELRHFVVLSKKIAKAFKN
jgi:energy-coupling factor transporter ATP-binding protein EcfA2